MKNCIKGNLVSLDQLSVIRDLKSIKNVRSELYKINQTYFFRLIKLRKKKMLKE
jgi:hypothetical protein